MDHRTWPSLARLVEMTGFQKTQKSFEDQEASCSAIAEYRADEELGRHYRRCETLVTVLLIVLQVLDYF